MQDQRLGRLSLLAIGAALVALIPALGMLGHMPRLRPTTPQHIKLPARLRLINAENGIGITLSPDGSRAAFSVAGADGRTRLCLYDLKSSRAQELPGTEGGQSPFWEPNGNRLGFFTVEELKTIDLANYSIKVLATVASPRGGSWSAKGVILFAPGTRGPIFRIPAEGGMPAAATMLDANTQATTHRWPSFLPDGNRFIFLEADHDLPEMPAKIMLGSLDGDHPRFLLESDSNAVPAADSLAYVSHGKLPSVHLDLQILQADAQAKILAEKIECAPGSWYCAFDLKRGGAVYRLDNSAADKQTIAWFDLAGNRIADYGRPGLYRSVDVSPDGKTVAVICGNPDEKVCLFHADGTVTALDSAGTTSASVWAPDSSAIAYIDHLSDSEFILKIKPVTHAAPAQAVLISKSDTVPVAWHPSGRYLLLSQSDPGDRHFSIRVLDLKTGETMPYMETDSPVGVTAEFSPDGRWLAYSKESEGIPEILVASFPVPTTVFPLTSDGGCAPKWRADGRGIFYLGRGDTLHYVPIVVRSRNFRLGMSAALFQPPIFSAPWNCTSFDISRDGHRFLVNTTGQSEEQELVYRPN